MRECADLCVAPDTPLQSVLVVIDRGAVEIVLITNEHGRLLGTVTDGDIRRTLMRGLPLSVPVAQVMNARFVSVGAEESPEQVVFLMRARGISQIPVVDRKGLLLGLHVLRDLIGPERRANWAVIMAGGQGKRLWPVTKYVPKPMLMVGGRPLVERLVTQLTACGVQRIFVSLNYLSHQIETHLGDGSQWDCDIQYLKEERALGTGGSLKLLPDSPEAPTLVVNGDLLTEVNFGTLVDFHQQHGHQLTMCVKEFVYQVPYGVVAVQEHRVRAFEEKPTQSCLVNAGIYVVNPEVIPLIPSGCEYHLTQLVDELLERGGAVGALPVTEFWSDIGRIEDYDRVVAMADADRLSPGSTESRVPQ